MNKANFDSLKHIKAPQEWLDQAAAIPETCAQKRHDAIPIYRVAAAASLVLVSVIGLLAYLSFGDKAPVTIHEKAPGETLSTEAGGSVPSSDDGSYPSFDTVFPTVTRVVPTDAEGNPVIDPSAEPTTVKAEKKAPSTEPTEKVLPSQHPAMVTEHAQNPTQVAPVQTEAPVPTNPPSPTAAPPTESPESIEPYPAVESDVTFSATFDTSLINDGETVYCVYAAEGYAPAERQRADYYITKNGIVCAYCEVLIDLPEESVTYQYIFVSESGRVLASGTQVV